MVSPSKVQHPERKQRENNTKETGRNSLSRAQNVPKPKLLENKTFYLDIKNHALSAKLEGKIKEFGGTVEVFLVRNVHIVISDRVDKSGQANSDKRKWAYASGGSGGPPSLRSIEVPTPTPTPPTPYFNADGPLSNSTNLRGQPTQRTKSRADAMLERALIQPQQCSVDPLKNAQNWNIPIWAPEKLQTWLDKIYLSHKDTNNLKQSSPPAPSKNLKVKVLKAPYIKFESYHRDTKPVFFELPSWPKINLDGEPGSCPFGTKRRQKKGASASKETKENWEAINIANKEKGKEMTRRPRATATRARRAEQLVAGYCEICRSEYRDLTKHVQSDQHLNFVQNNDNFLSLDTLISTGASVEAFLKLNTLTDIRQDCNLFPNGNHSLRSSVLSEKVDKTAKKVLKNFGVEEIKMVQCNGARRNLDLKLSSPHNLRTREKKECGHLLRSKGRTGDKVEKTSEKLYDKFEGYTIKKRAKGTIWIEEDDPEDKSEDENKKDVNECNDKVLLDLDESELKSHRRSNGHSESNNFIKSEVSRNLIQEIDSKKKKDSGPRINGHEPNENVSHNAKKDSSVKHSALKNSLVKHSSVKDSLVKHSSVKDSSVKHSSVNDSSIKHSSVKDSAVKHSSVKHSSIKDSSVKNSSVKDSPVKQSSVKDSPIKDLNGEMGKYLSKEDKNGVDPCSNDDEEKDCRGFKTPSRGEKDVKDTKDAKAQSIRPSRGEKDLKDSKDEKAQSIRVSRRGGRSCRGRQRTSIEERLIEDVRSYYKVEVVPSKLKSNAIAPTPPVKVVKEVVDEVKKDEGPSSEKPVVVRFKRVRKSELSLLSDEAESFMFGDPRRDDSSEASEGDQSSVLPKETESDREDTMNSINLSSPCNSSLVKQEVMEDSQDSGNMGRARKKRRTQAEALIKDNADYYKFETPGSRLRFQAPMTGIEDLNYDKPDEEECNDEEDSNDGLVPSKPSPEIEKMQFSFEAIPKSEPWYQTYTRQDGGQEFWHYFSESDAQKPFLLPYEIENFHETLFKRLHRSDGRRRSRGRGSGIGRSPRKSPRCHASTLAIMSTIIRKREQQQHTPNLNAIVEEDSQSKSEASSKKDFKQKSDVDEDLQAIAKNIDEMLSAKDFQLQEAEDSFEDIFLPNIEETAVEETQIPKGAPVNLLELLENCHELIPCLENSSCASSDCGEGNGESPLKRRKRRKNRTGWPGNKLRRKLHTKQMAAAYENEKRSEATTQLAAVKEEACERLQAPSSEATSERDIRNSEKRASKSSGSCSFGDCGERRNGSADTPNRRSQSSEDSKSEKLKDETTCSKKDLKGKKESSSETEELASRRDSSKSRKTSLESEEIFSKRDSSKVKKESSSETEEMSSSKRDSSQTSSKTSEGSSGNDENLKTVKKKNYRLPTSSSDRECRSRRVMLNVSPRKRNMTKALIRNRGRRRATGSSESHVVTYKTKCLSRRMQKLSRKRPSGRATSPLVLENENCKKSSYLNMSPRTRLRRVRGGISSDAGDVDCALSERVNSPVGAPIDLQNRRSSIEFQPVVRVMKIEDQVDRDHSILSVKVASNRRLRSSGSSPKSSQPPKKRFKGRGHYSPWLKTS
ncbi:titin homolog [Belonocnema kinseyi]|uniref:titin homolog n=1 Tax=Belonocnema kinseyi TaxID=2817044 RepID=UPI00143CF08C|nr:titin homolog [Belonocnema kinseyi]